MINGLGVLGWGVGGIEAEAAMLGQPISMLLPQVVGFKLDGELPEGATATDLVLTVTEMLRERGVVGKFVEFFGPGLHTLGLADRATIGNMSPEFGSTCAIFPVDARDAALPRVHRPADRADRAGRRLRARAGHVPRPRTPRTRPSPRRSSSTSATVEPSIAGPKRPQDRIALADAKPAFLESLRGVRPRGRRAAGQRPRRGRRRVLPGLRPAGRGPRRRARQAAPGGRGRRRAATSSAAATTRSRSRSRTGPRSSSTTAAS